MRPGSRSLESVRVSRAGFFSRTSPCPALVWSSARSLCEGVRASCGIRVADYSP